MLLLVCRCKIAYFHTYNYRDTAEELLESYKDGNRKERWLPITESDSGYDSPIGLLSYHLYEHKMNLTLQKQLHCFKHAAQRLD